MAQLRLDIADDVKDEIQAYADKYGMKSVAEAVRILLRKGLDAENGSGR